MLVLRAPIRADRRGFEYDDRRYGIGNVHTVHPVVSTQVGRDADASIGLAMESSGRTEPTAVEGRRHDDLTV